MPENDDSVTGQSQRIMLRDGRECGLYIDMRPGVTVAAGDWVATDAGSRYLVVSSRLVNRRRPSRLSRFALRCTRLEHGSPVPDDVQCHWLTWYKRGRHA